MELFGFMNALSNLGWLIQNYGPLLVAVVFFIWRDFRREDKLNSRIVKLEDEQREVILPLVRDTTKVIVQNTEVMKQSIKVMDRLEHALNR
jgi:hypothetical protein